MKYYYLNDDKKPQGPYSENELAAFKQSGLINDETLAAVAGDSKWRRLGDLLNKEVEADCSTWNKELGKCPHCEQMLEGASVPEVCPHCQKSIHGANKGLWYAFLYAVKNSFNYKGRATRTEFWGFYLFSYIISLAVGQITGIFVSEQQAILEQEVAALDENATPAEAMRIICDFFTDPSVIVSQGISIIISLALFIPMLAVTARRLHDTGRSVASLVAGCVSYVVMLASSVAMFAILASNFEGILADTYNMEEEIQVMSTFLAMLVSFGIFCLISIYLFVMMVLPSNPGSNKYGPSTLFPKA